MRTPSKTQMQAIDHYKGPALICAGPGSGKTFTIIQRILRLVNKYHVQSDKILVITYTKAAANEMKERFEAESTHSGVHFGTFHSICYNILRQSGVVTANSLISESDKRKLFQIILGNQGLSSKSGYDSVTALSNMISRMKNIQTLCPEENAEFTSHEILNVKKEYDRYLREQKMLDFDDMIIECLKLLMEHEAVCRKYQQMFQYILADEFQDVNQPQYEILKLLSAPLNNLFVVGDDDQAIYGFRGASPSMMQQFLTDFPDGKQIMLTENYRSGKEIIGLSEQMIKQNKERFRKEFHPVRDGGQVVFSCFETRKDEELGLIKDLTLLKVSELCHTAILTRTNRESIQYAELLKGVGIAIKGKVISKEDVFHSFIMEDIQAFLSYLYYGKNRCDLIRFMNKPNRFFTRAALPLEKVNPVFMEQYYAKNPAMCSEVRRFFAQLHIAEKLSPVLAITFFRKNLCYDRFLRDKAQNSGELQHFIRQADQIQHSFEAYRIGMSLSDFMKDQFENSGAGLSKMTNDGVSILTMHSSKGLEFEKVYLPDVNEGIIPGREIRTEAEHEEERRLLYVAITRAKNDLFIYYTKERNRKLSRYLEGLNSPP